MPQHTPPPPLVGDKPQQRLIPVEASPDRTGPSTDILNQPVSSESLNKMLVPLPEPKKQLVPVDDSKDIDVFSDMDKLEDQDEVVDSDGSESSDTLDMSIGGFASENTDTIKKQPTRLSPRRSTASEQDAFDAEIIMASASPVVASSSISRQQSSSSNPQEKTSTAVAVDSFTDERIPLGRRAKRSSTTSSPCSLTSPLTWTACSTESSSFAPGLFSSVQRGGACECSCEW